MFPIENAVPTRYPPLATWGLIATNCIVFLFQISLSPDELGIFLTRFALIPAQYFTPGFDTGLAPSSYLPFLTNIFLHGGWLHLIVNMWTLWLFGGTVEDRLGRPNSWASILLAGCWAPQRMHLSTRARTYLFSAPRERSPACWDVMSACSLGRGL